MSVSEEIMGLAINAGSIPIFFANNGNMLPMHFAAATIANIATETVKAIVTWFAFPDCSNITLTKFKMLKDKPIKKLILISFHSTFKPSFNSMSPKDIPLITKVADCDPEFPGRGLRNAMIPPPGSPYAKIPPRRLRRANPPHPSQRDRKSVV